MSKVKILDISYYFNYTYIRGYFIFFKGMLTRNRECLGEVISDKDLIIFLTEHFRDIKKVQWSNEKIQNQLGRRTLQEILESHETCYMGSCVDMTLSFFRKMKEKYPCLNLTLWCELLKHKKSGILSLHFFLKNEDKNQIIDFVRNNQVALYEGAYRNPWNSIIVDQVALLSLPWDQVKDTDSLLTLAHKLWIPFSEQDFQLFLNKLKSDNTDQEFQDFSKKRSWLHITLNGKKVDLSRSELFETLQD